MILITGATGTVGREVVRQLVAAGERPRVAVRDLDTARPTFGPDVEYVRADLDRPETLPAALAGAKRLFLLTPASFRQLTRERRIVEAAVAAGVRHVVKLSVFRAAPAAHLRIARQHGQIENLVVRSGLDWTFLRPVFFMQNLVGQILNGALYTAAESGRVALVDARDVATAAVAALTTPSHIGRAYTLTGPQALTFDQVAATVSAVFEAPCPHVRVSADRIREAMLRSGAESWFADDMAQLHTMLAAGYEDVVTDDVRTLTGSAARSVSDFADVLALDLAGVRAG